MTEDPRTRPSDLADEEPETTDDLATAEAKSRSVDERIPDRFGTDRAKAVDTPAPGPHVPQSGIGLPAHDDDEGPGEAVLDQERKHLRTKKQPG